MATSDTTPRVSILFHCVWFSNTSPSPEQLQRPTAQGQCHTSIGRSVEGCVDGKTIKNIQHVKIKLRCFGIKLTMFNEE